MMMDDDIDVDLLAEIEKIEAAHRAKELKEKNDLDTQIANLSPDETGDDGHTSDLNVEYSPDAASPVPNSSTALVLHPDAAAIQAAKAKEAQTSSTTATQSITITEKAAKPMVQDYLKNHDSNNMPAFFSTASSSSSLSSSSSSSSSSSTCHAFDSRQLSLGADVDALDCASQWLKGRVVKVGKKKVLVNFNGWADRFVSQKIQLTSLTHSTLSRGALCSRWFSHELQFLIFCFSCLHCCLG